VKILIMTVGGDPNPVVQSINEMKPDYIYFICSSGQQTSRVTIEGPSKPKVLEQTKFPLENIKIVEVEPDDPGGVYEMAKRIIAECEGHEVYADYTPGTKSISSGLLAAALEFDYCQLILMKGPRADLVKVTGDRSRVIMINRYSIIFSRLRKMFDDMLSRQDYGGAKEIIRTISRIGAEKRDEEFLDRANVVMNAFELWDRFEYKRAWEDLDYFSRSYTPNEQMIEYKIMAWRIAGIVDWMKKGFKRQENKRGTETNAI